MSTFHIEGLESRRLFSVPTGFSETRIGPEIARTTSMTLAPDGRIFVSQQDGNLRVIKNGQLLSDPFLRVTTHNAGERGLMGSAFDPDFATNRYLYVYYTAIDDGGQYRNRVSRFRASAGDPDRVESGSETVLLDLDPLGSSEWHNGGSLHFGPDGKLYVSVGENNVGSNAQSLSKALGKMLRINRDGSIPSDNPFYGQTSGRDRAIWAMGLRNPFTFAFQPGTGRMFINDVGGSKAEEINEGQAGANYGWPGTEGDTSNPSYTTPFYAYNHGSTGSDAIAGGAFYNPVNPTFPSEYLGDYFFGDYGTGIIKRIDTSSKSVFTFATGATAVLDVEVADDGSLYYLTRHEGVFHVVRTGSSAPVITVHPQGQTVSNGQNVTFAVTASGSELTYQWQRNGVDIDGATGSTYSLNPADLGDDGDAFRVIVTNSAGSVTSNAANLTVLDNDAPTATIVTPTADAVYQAGTTLEFSGTGTDPEDGDLPASAFTWRVEFHHGTHDHPALAPFSGATSGSMLIPDSGHEVTDVWYRVHLTVTDSAGLTHSTFRDVHPVLANIGLATNIPGLSLTLDGAPVAAPYGEPSVVGLKRNLGAPASQVLDGVLYEFVGWSDGGDREHDVTTPATDTVYTATYVESDGVLETIGAAADSYVRNGGSAGSNFGNASEILVKRSRTTGNTRETYLRFNLGDLGEIGSAKLRLFGKLTVPMDSGLLTRVYAVSNTTWSEGGITWNNKPSTGTALGDLTVTETTGQWYELDVTDYLRQQQLAGATAVSFAIKAPDITDPWIILNSSEAATNQPALAVVHTGTLPPPPPPPPGSDVTLSALADAYVRDGSKNVDVNFGSATDLVVKNDTPGYTREAYLRFDLSAVDTIGQATLRLFGAANNPGSVTVGVYGSSNTSWAENGITWNTRPGSSSSPLSTATVTGTTDGWYEWDVTAYLQAEKAAGRNLVTLVLKGPSISSTSVLFNSDEAAANRPELVVA